MRAIATACLFLLLCCPASAAEKPDEKRDQKPAKVESPRSDSARPCSDIYRAEQAVSAGKSDSLNESLREAMVRSSSPLGRVLHQLSCLLVRT